MIAVVALTLSAGRALTHPYPISSFLEIGPGDNAYESTGWSDGTTTPVKSTHVKITTYPLVTIVKWSDGGNSYHLRLHR